MNEGLGSGVNEYLSASSLLTSLLKTRTESRHAKHTSNHWIF